MTGPDAIPNRPVQNAWFTTTHWSIVLVAGEGASPHAAEALEKLCSTYWLPLYTYVLRRGHGPEDAQDMTQEFFARFLSKNSFGRARPERGRFRSFLLTSMQNFLAHEWQRARAEKRGGGRSLLRWDELAPENHYQLEAASELTPDKVFDQRWALRLFQQALARLRQEFTAAGKGAQFDRLKGYLSSDAGENAYAEVAAQLNLTPRAVAVAVHPLRQRYGQIVREAIAQRGKETAPARGGQRRRESHEARAPIRGQRQSPGVGGD